MGFSCFAAAAGVVFALVPVDMRPRHAWPLAYEWLLFTYLTLLAAWFMVCPLHSTTSCWSAAL